MQGYVTKEQAAAMLGMSPATFDRRRAEGKIGTHYFSVRKPMFSEKELQAYAERCRVVKTKDNRKARKKSAKRRAHASIDWVPGEKLV